MESLCAAVVHQKAALAGCASSWHCVILSRCESLVGLPNTISPGALQVVLLCECSQDIMECTKNFSRWTKRVVSLKASIAILRRIIEMEALRMKAVESVDQEVGNMTNDGEFCN